MGDATPMGLNINRYHIDKNMSNFFLVSREWSRIPERYPSLYLH